MKALGVPFVWNCAWRTVFPSLYLQRFVFWDTWLSAILVDRIWACIGELAWTCQIALALWMIDSRITNSSGGTGRTWVRVSAVTAVGLYVMAEAVSFYNTATTNEWYAAAEVILDGVSWLQMAPAIAVLFSKAPGTVCMSTGKFFLAVMAVLCLVYPLYNFVVDAPMCKSLPFPTRRKLARCHPALIFFFLGPCIAASLCCVVDYARYRADQARNKTYFEFIDGLVDAATRRIVTHEIRAWDEDLSWMTIYFSAAAWLVSLPRLVDADSPPADPCLSLCMMAGLQFS